MKNKKVNIVLIAAALVVWILIIAKVLDYKKGPPSLQEESLINIEKDQYITNKDTIKLILNYTDPFLKTKIIKPAVSSNSIVPKSVRARQSNPKTQIVKWPDIIYGGLIENSAEGEQLGLFSIENRKYITRINDSVCGVSVLEITPDTLFVSFNKETRGISKTITR